MLLGGFVLIWVEVCGLRSAGSLDFGELTGRRGCRVWEDAGARNLGVLIREFCGVLMVGHKEFADLSVF